MMRIRRSWRWFAAGFLPALLCGALALAALTRTTAGRRLVLRTVMSIVGGAVKQGELHVGKIAGNLFTGAWIYDLSIREPNGDMFLEVDSAYADYHLAELISDQLVVRRLVLFHPRATVRRVPGDTLWNYQRIFNDTLAPGRPSERTTTLRRLRLVDARVQVLLPWRPDSTLSAGQQRAAIRAALSDTGQIIARAVPGGFLRTTRFTQLNGVVSRAFFPSPVGKGSYLRVDGLSGLAYLYREPIRLRRVEGEMVIRDSILEVRAPTVLLPDSRLAVAGTVTITDPEPRYDLAFRIPKVAARDVQWLFPQLPERGGGELDLLWETRPDGTLFHVWNMDVALPGTRVAGNFGVVIADTVRFTDVHLRADPLRVSTVESLLPEPLPVRGLRIGSVEVRGPAQGAERVLDTGVAPG